MSLKLSIIIPVCNTEKYICQCLDSVKNQTLDDIEIIIVDNGSTDNSVDIIKKYETKNKNITVLEHHDGRQGAARNAGMKIARGDYIGFVDSDDFVSPDMFEKMYIKALSASADIVICNIQLFFQENNETRLHLPEKWFDKTVFQVDENAFFFRNLTICNKIFNRKFLQQNKIFFPEEYFHEDQVFVVKSYTLSRTIASLKDPLYVYRKQRVGSVSQHRGKRSFEIFPIMNLIDCFIKEKDFHNRFGQVMLETKILKYLQLFQVLKNKYKKIFFVKMQQEFRKQNLQFPPKILSESEYRDYQLIKKRVYGVFVMYSHLRLSYGKMLLIPILGSVVRFMKTKLSKKSIL